MTQFKKSNVTELADFWRAAPLADELGIARTTLLKAMERGDVDVRKLGDGLPVVNYSSAKKWITALKFERQGAGFRSKLHNNEPQLSDKTVELFKNLAARKKEKTDGDSS